MMILQCRNCAGNITADDEAIHRGIVTCDYCQAVSRITEQGLEAYKKRVLDGLPPDGIKVRRTGSSIKISVPVKMSDWKMRSQADGLSFAAIFTGTVVIGLFVWFLLPKNEFTWQLSCVSMVGALFLLHHFFTESNPYLRIDEEVLESYLPPLFPVSPKVAISEIKQLYVTTNRVQDETGVRNQHSLFVMKKSGERERIFGDFATVYGAIFVEELLEIELDIFNLPVYGEVQTSTADVVAFQNKPDEELFCYACAAPLQVTRQVRQKGYITCGYCLTMSLFYTQSSHKPILGQPDFAQMVFKVVCRADKAGVLWNKDAGGVLLLKGNQLTRLLLNPGLQGKKVARIGVKETAVARDVGFKEIISGKAAKKVEENLAYSAEANLSQPLDVSKIVNHDLTYTIVGQIEGTFHDLISNLQDVREAAFIVTMLNDYLAGLGE